MKNKEKILFLLSTVSVFTYTSGWTYESHDQNPQYEWVDEKDIAIREDGVYIDSNKGLMKVIVIEEDKENKRYLIDCPFFVFDEKHFSDEESEDH